MTFHFGKVLKNMLEDKYGRLSHYLRLSVTDVCNVSCDYCLPDGDACDTDRDFLPLNKIQTLINGFCATCNRLRVAATGKRPLFLFAKQGLDIRPALQSTDPQALQAQSLSLLADKQATHWLRDGYTGATEHLAMLGG
jgi:molybdenum cofactor biosynthesis enzyme MoaA